MRTNGYGPNDKAERATSGSYSWPMCGAKTRKGSPCRGKGIQPSGRCRLHGGLTPRGSTSVHFKHGRYSRSLVDSLPERFKDRFEAAIADPQLLSLRGYIGVFDARVIESLERWTASDSASYRAQLLASWSKFKKTNTEKAETQEERAQKAQRVLASFNEIDQLISSGADAEAAWENVVSSIRDRAALTMQENRRLVDLAQFLTIEEAMHLVLSLYGAVTKNISDPKLLRKLGRDIEEACGLLSNLPSRPLLTECSANAAEMDSPAGDVVDVGDAVDVVDAEATEPQKP